MIKLEETKAWGIEHAIRGMRNPMNSWNRSDSHEDNNGNIQIGDNDKFLMKNLINAGPTHRKFLRQMFVSVDITAPLYWWKEFDTYKVGTTSNSCSTMHKIHSKKFTRTDFSMEHMDNPKEQHWAMCMDNVIDSLNVARERYLTTKDKYYWWQMIQLLPASYNQKRTITMTYENLLNMYETRKNHKLDEWKKLCKWIETLPYAQLITEAEKDEAV